MSHMDGVELKLARAETHLREFDQASMAFLNREDAYSLTGEYDNDTRRLTMYCEAHVPVPAELSAVAGDVVNNLRASLDYIVYALSNAKGKKRSAWPVCRTEADWNEATSKELCGVKANVVEIIKGFQPYGRGDDRDLVDAHPLAVLNSLWNHDKHKRLLITQCAVLPPLPGTLNITGNIDHVRVGAVCFDQKTEILSARIRPGDTEAKIQAETPITVAFSDSGPAMGAPCVMFLTHVLDEIRTAILPRFKGILL